MLQALLPIIAFIVAILMLVTVHEYGHCWVAKRLGIKVLRFSIGFGKPICRWHGKDGTEYWLAMLPLGGYVKLLDEREGPVASEELHFAYNRKPVWARMLVVLAGPVTNFLLAILLFWLVFVVGFETVKPIVGNVALGSPAAAAGMKPGEQIVAIDHRATPSWQKVMLALTWRLGSQAEMTVVTKTDAPTAAEKTYVLDLKNWQVDGLNPDPIKGLGITPYHPPVPPVIARVLNHQPAAEAGIMPNDRVVAVAGVPVSDWYDVVTYIQAHPNTTVPVKIQRGEQTKTVMLTIGQKSGWRWHAVGFIGAEAKAVEWPAALKQHQQYNVITAWLPAVNETLTYSAFNFVIFGKMVLGQVSLKGLGGPISIFTSAGNAFKEGLVVYCSFLAVLSIMLACINILPIPGLDGGHLLYLVIEAIKKRPVSVEAQLMAWRIGLFFLLLLMLIATMNDLLRAFQ